MTKVFTLTILTPEKQVTHGDVRELVVPTKAGEIGILARHTPLVTLLRPGEMMIDSAETPEREYMAVSTGFLEVRESGDVVVLVETLEAAGEIDVVRAEQARARVEAALVERDKLEQPEIDELVFELNKQLARLKVAKRNGKSS